jgi:ring-1,2-phenylacetyl-CoA epoxidase subunit PaaB
MDINKEINRTENQGELFEVFIQSKAGQAYKHAGSVHAYDREMAIENARDTYTRRGEGTGIWVVPSKEISSISVSEANYFIEPSMDKIYRHPTFYNLPEGVKNM